MNFKFLDFCKLRAADAALLKSFNDNTLGINRAKQGLSVRLRATHAALFNKNRRFYLPSIMERDTNTFVTNRNKPAKILKHHNDASDPVGIITGAKFVWTIPEDLKTNKDVLTIIDSSLPITKQIKGARSFMQSGIPFQDGWEGLGYIDLDAMILDEKTIYQVSTGLFDAVSTSFLPGADGVYCTECMQNLVKDGLCSHEPGKVYEDEDCIPTY